LDRSPRLNWIIENSASVTTVPLLSYLHSPPKKMNVAALLQDSPSEDSNNRRRPIQHTNQDNWPTPQSQLWPSPYIRPDQPHPPTSSSPLAPPPFSTVDSRTGSNVVGGLRPSPPNPPNLPRSAPFPTDSSSPRTRPRHPSPVMISSTTPRHVHDTTCTTTSSQHPSPAMASLRPIETPITPGSWHPGSSIADRDRERLGDSRIQLDSRLIIDNTRTPMDWPERDRRKQTATLAGPGTGAPGMFNFSYFLSPPSNSFFFSFFSLSR